MKHAVLSISGGMDSTSLLLHLLSRDYFVHCISFNYGQKHVVELERVEKNIRFLQILTESKVEWEVIDLSQIMRKFHSSLTSDSMNVPEGHYADENMKSTVVPNRNAIFSSLIYGYALSLSKSLGEDVQICLGTHSGDHAIYPDCRPEFHTALDYAFKIGNWGSERVSNYLPYLQLDKAGILRDALASCVVLKIDPFMIFENTNTCYQPNEKGESCGKCGSCTERLEAFERVGIVDPVKYVSYE